MHTKRLALAAIICAFALTATAQEQPRCKVESKYDRFTDITEDLCTIQTVNKISVLAIANYKGKRATDEPRYSFVLSYLDKEAFLGVRPIYDKADALFLLVDGQRRQIPLKDYRNIISPPLKGRVLHIESWMAELDREMWKRLLDAKKIEMRLGETEIELTDDARTLLHNFTAQVEQP